MEVVPRYCSSKSQTGRATRRGGRRLILVSVRLLYVPIAFNCLLCLRSPALDWPYALCITTLAVLVAVACLWIRKSASLGFHAVVPPLLCALVIYIDTSSTLPLLLASWLVHWSPYLLLSSQYSQFALVVPLIYAVHMFICSWIRFYKQVYKKMKHSRNKAKFLQIYQEVAR